MATVALTIAVPDRTGAARMLVNYATALRDRGHRVRVIHGPAPRDADGHPTTILSDLERAGIETRAVDRLRRPLPPVAERQVARAAAPADVIIGFNQRDRATAARAAHRLGVPSILAIQNQHNFWGPKPLPQLKRRFYRRAAIDNVALSVCTSPTVERELIDMGLTASKCVVLRNGIELSRPPSLIERAQARHAIGLADDQRVFVNVGRLDVQKGQDLLIEAWAESGASRSGARLLLVGGVSEGAQAATSQAFHDRLEARIDALGLSQSVELLGWRDDIDEVLAAADACIHPARWEGWPLAVLEAMAAGLPVIMSDCAGAPEGHDPRHHGPIVAVGDQPALIEAIEQFIRLPADELARRGANSRDLVAEHYDIDRIGNRFVDLVEAVLDQPR